ncbi:MAG: hypothetical protein WC661_00610 [Opitutaceae bacterium]|jgi:hypothetical protein
MSDTPRLGLYRRLTRSVPILVTVIIHAVVVGIAGYVVTETLINKKKILEAAPPMDSSFKKQVEHRLQVARKAGGSAPSPVSAQRIVSTASDALQLPDMPQLPQVGASSLSGAGFGAGMGTAGPGTGFNTGGLGTGNSGAGFMPMSFLGITNQRASKVVFAVDVSQDLMDIRKGGFLAFGIIRDEIMRLVSTLSSATEFNVVLSERSGVRLFADQLMPGTVENKTKFFAWMKPINSNMDNLGLNSAKGSVPWRRVIPPNSGIDPDYRAAWWLSPVHAAIQLKPDVIFVITGSYGNGWLEMSDADFAKVKADYERADKAWVEDLKRRRMDPDEVVKARNAALSKARADLTAINRKQEAAGKPPFIVVDNKRLVEADIQAAVRKAGYADFKVDLTGWSTKDGLPMWQRYWQPVKLSNAGPEDAQKFISRLQATFLRQTASLNIFYFVGPSYKPDSTSEAFNKLARRYNGKFEILTTERLKQIQKASEEAAK